MTVNLLVSGRWDEHQDFDSKGTYSVQLSHNIEAAGLDPARDI